jgi:PDZ domain-containing secreted protein
MQVGIVWDTTLDGKVKAGDQIIAIDEISYENIDVCDLITKESTNSKEKITLTTKNQAREIQKTIIEKK